MQSLRVTNEDIHHLFNIGQQSEEKSSVAASQEPKTIRIVESVGEI